MKPREALELQLRLEGLEVIRDNLLRQVEIVPGEELPILLMAQLADGQLVVLYDGESLQAELHQELETQCLLLPDLAPALTVLRTHHITFETGHYRSCVFPATRESAQNEVICRFRRDPQIHDFGFGDFAEHVFVREVNGRIASACVSARENDQCGEAWVYTDPQFRRQGFARQVVSAWAQSLLVAGKIPFYSHKVTNVASANLAGRLGLEPVFEEIVILYG